jgi:hypothetical protein
MSYYRQKWEGLRACSSFSTTQVTQFGHLRLETENADDLAPENIHTQRNFI